MVDKVSVAVIYILTGLLIGWIYAHMTIADECKKLEAFYVGNTVFICKEK